MKKIQTVLLFLLIGIFSAAGQYKTLYDFSARTINGETLDFSTLKGKKVLLVNTATECALTPQFKKLQELYEEYGGDDFEIIAFPSNDFGSQEPGDNEHIKEYCTKKFGVSFQLMEKISIKENPHPIYKWLTSSEENGTLDGKVIWNFQKFLIDEDGTVVESLSPITGPQNRRIVEWLQE
ncbi:glutathione peroxidase [Tangfeifania diversioriginum]|uniref:Glutathione peroxidase n=1 Tax=Tangfeifania diversioriginum TaxID=1168035 RepID=A0A1M6LCC9_9BACT|nr:glutathione peroxidase [Tangfeifania diversioriginum]SHJ68910.1 glutathione peroxidase [Tangfeifania diversioriginum]